MTGSGTAHPDVDVVVVGAGQAGLAAAHHLSRRLPAGGSFVVLDANDGPGGAWRHRWDSLTLGRAHRVHDLPGLPLVDPDPDQPAAQVVADYYGRYEQHYALPVRRPVRVAAVTAPEGPQGPLVVATDAGTWTTRALISATGTWDRPYWPRYPGQERFGGRQLHTHDYTSAEDFRGQRVVVVGGGTSAVQHLLEIAPVAASTTWVTRRPPQFVDRPFDAEWGREVERRVAERVRAGLPPVSVVGTTGLPLTEEYRRGIDSGVLVARPMFTEITPRGVRFADGAEVVADVILWATGFRASLDHLAPLHLREPSGGIRMADTTVVRDPRVQLVGFGPSASTLGATRAGRLAALAAVRSLTTSGTGLTRENEHQPQPQVES
ncbi:FAD-dependent oxidoreductase [Rhodococcus sp. X156]|uniref:FAD-dependent oxidoreductase n=1 Tax=Rhodococcus sp. X156 TaxID=2499145 RepID=UPI000FDAADB5|nr:FAD-dependent oxidoreductase [Rhodococcus sp. X156]